MVQARTDIAVYLETGTKRTFAGAIDWPGLCRSGRDEVFALEALVAYGPRYARALRAVGMESHLPLSASGLTVVERLAGNATTDFGTPAMAPQADERPINDAELERFMEILGACWLALRTAAASAAGKSLRKGPRGGGRDLPRILDHVAEANRVYPSKLAWKPATEWKARTAAPLEGMLEETLKALGAAVAGELPARGPRGGKLWLPRYFVRRAAWHVLDHAWEIKDRLD